MSEITIRLLFFVFTLIFFGLWESFYPKRKQVIAKKIRWMTNLSLVMLNNLILKIVIPLSSVVVCLYAEQNQIGLFNQIPIGLGLAIFLSVLLLDLIIYSQHFIFHHLPFFWRFHQIHHIDQEIDVTTGLRFHPIEILFSMLIKYAAILILGIPILGFIIFEILLNVSSMFNHSNLKLPSKIDYFLKMLIVTPDMHRVHHSTKPKETNRNFGFNLAIWDRLFKTYQAEPGKGQLNMKIGLNEYQNIKKTNLVFLLKLPFIKQK